MTDIYRVLPHRYSSQRLGANTNPSNLTLLCSCCLFLFFISSPSNVYYDPDRISSSYHAYLATMTDFHWEGSAIMLAHPNPSVAWKQGAPLRTHFTRNLTQRTSQRVFSCGWLAALTIMPLLKSYSTLLLRQPNQQSAMNWLGRSRQGELKCQTK